MKQDSWTYKILSLEKGEAALVMLPIIYSFFTGVSLAYFVTSSTSLFLSSFKNDMLSVAFIVAGVIVWLIGQVFSLIQKRFSFSKSLILGLGFLLVSVFIFIGFFIGSRPLFIIFLIYAWIRVFAYMHAIIFWGIAGRLFTLRQGKRLFGLISGGEVLASIISFLSVPFLLKIISTEDLLLLSGINLFIGFVVLLFIVKKFPMEFEAGTDKKAIPAEKKNIKKPTFMQNRYYKLFFVIAFVPIFAQFFIDFIFQAQAKIEYPSKEDLTSFVGVFFGLSSIVEFILKTFISGRLMSKYGMRLGLLAFPVVLTFSLVMASLFGLIYGTLSLFFSFIALGRLFTRAVRTSFNDPATQLLYQPIPHDERSVFQNKVEGGPKAYASIVAGIFLLLLANIPGLNLVYFSIFLLVISFLWMMSANEIYKEYKTVLQNILAEKSSAGKRNDPHPLIQQFILEINAGRITIANSLKKLANIIFPAEIERVSSSAKLTKEDDNAQDDLKFSTVIALSKSENAADRITAIKQMNKFSIYKVEKPIIRLLHDIDFEVKCEAIYATSKLKETDLYNHLITLFHNPEYRLIVSDAIIRIGQAILKDLDQNFQKTEYDVATQIKTVELIENIRSEKSLIFLKRNINHHNKFVSDRVVQALGKLNYRANTGESLIIWQKVENEIKNYVFVVSAYQNLLGKLESSELIEILESEKKEKKNKVFTNLSVLYDPFAIMLIAESIESKDKNSHGFALEVADIVISDLHKPILQPLLESESDAELLQKYSNYFPSEKLDIIEQLIDLINAEYWVFGLMGKAIAIQILAKYNNPKIYSVLMANAVHPRQIIWQLAAFSLYKINPSLFATEIYYNSHKVKGLKEFVSDIEAYAKGQKTLIYDKLISLKSIPVFNSIQSEEIIELATSSKKLIFHSGDEIIIDKNERFYYIILSGTIQSKLNNQIFGSGSIFLSYIRLSDYETEKFVCGMDSETLLIEMHVINNLIHKNRIFAEAITRLLLVNKPDNVLEIVSDVEKGK